MSNHRVLRVNRFPVGRKFFPFLAVIALLMQVVVLPAWAEDDAAARRREFYDSLKILGDVYERIINNYVDEVDPHEIMEAGINGMLDTLDPHSNYLPPVNYEDLVMSTEGEFGGLGISINIRDHFPTVVSPIEGTPAYYMGVQGGDQIIEVEGESTFDFTSREAVKLLRGPAGTKVNILIQRPGVEKPMPLTVTRDIIKIESVPYAFVIEDVGYIRVQNFARTTRDELKVKLDELYAQGVRGLILDLRFNPGGLLDAAQGVSELFLKPDQMVVSTKGRLRSQNRSFHCQSRGKIYNDVPTIVMINGSSASASEIVAAALQDHDAGLVVGKTSFGKGSVQTVFRLDDDEALKLTTARYYTPSGRSIHKKRSRHPEEMVNDQDAAEPLANVPAEEEVHRFHREKFYTDSGRVVYGGGGITPDIEIDQDFLTDFEVAVERDGALFSFAVDQVQRNSIVSTPENISDEMFNEFRQTLKERENIDEYLGDFEMTMSDSLLDANSEFLKRGIRRELARRIEGPQAAYQVAIEADTQLHAVLDLFRKAKTLPELLQMAEDWNREQMEQMEQMAAEDAESEEEPVQN